MMMFKVNLNQFYKLPCMFNLCYCEGHSCEDVLRIKNW